MIRYLSLLFLFLIYSCNSNFLSDEAIRDLAFNKTNEHQIIFYNETVEVSDDGEVTLKVHKLLKVGNNLRSLPTLIYVHDNSIEKLIDYAAKIKTENETRYFSLSDLQTFNFSNAYVVSEDEWRILPKTDVINPGDLIESFSIHEHTLPNLGFRFSPYMSNAEAFNISYTFITPSEDSLHYKVYNTFSEPTIKKTENKKIYSFKWENFTPNRIQNIVQYQNKYPHILSSINSNSWIDFGKWYLDLIEHRLNIIPEIDTLARELTQGINTDLEKMNAIFNHVQKNYRYEQVYLEKGGFIPNEPATIIKNKFGDCKDYSTIIYLLARSLDIPANLALCYRGRGMQFHEEIAVSQFNHLIVNYNDNGQDYWYDGTNRTGINGVPTKDLINQRALIIDRDNSHLTIIKESKNNKLIITGDLISNKENIMGTLNIVLKEQYAMDFFYFEYYLNHAKFKGYLVDWIKENIGSNITINGLDWSKNDDLFQIKFNCVIPNSLVNIGNYSYLSLSRLFNEIIPKIDLVNTTPPEINYFPNYHDIEIKLFFPDLITEEENGSKNINYTLYFSQYLSPGPFSNSEKDIFIRDYLNSYSQFEKQIKLQKGE